MTTLLRVLISVTPADDGWLAAFSCPADPAFQAQRRLARVAITLPGAYDPTPFPAPVFDDDHPPPAVEAPHHALCTDPGTHLGAVYDRIVHRRPAAGDVKAFGAYLFATLIGASIWEAIRALARRHEADLLDLALAWPATEGALHRLNWEMMHGPETLLAALQSDEPKEVAITRVVLSTPDPAGAVVPRSGCLVPRKLFVIGTDLNDPVIRPGAEFFGLLRRVKHNKHTVHTRVLRRASSQKLREVIKTFQPDVVHFICHGHIDKGTGRGYLELAVDDDEAAGDEAEKRRYAEQVFQFLNAGERRPSVVVLSACDTGQGQVGEMLGAHELAPFAAELVQQGIAAVVGMAGSIADRACRHFTRRFGEAIVQREPLVKATADGRRAAFVHGADPESAVDWAFPALFTAAAVPPDYSPAPPPDPAAPSVDDWIHDFNVERDPVFCGRLEFFEAYYRLFEERDLAVLLVHGSRGLGKTRLLQEFTAQAIREAHLPIGIYSDAPDWAPPPTLDALRDELRKAVSRTREILELTPRLWQLKLLEDPAANRARLDDLVLNALPAGGGLTTEAVKRALQSDLGYLLAQACADYPGFFDAAHSRAVLLLDEVQDYDEAILRDLLIDEVLGPRGIGTKKEPIPVILTCELSGPARHLLEPFTQQHNQTRPWMRVLPLKPFPEEHDQDLFEYERVWLNPSEQNAMRTGLPPAMANVAYVIEQNAARSNQDWEEWLRTVRTKIQGKPINTVSSDFIFLAALAEAKRIMAKADDEALLDAYMKRGHNGP